MINKKKKILDIGLILFILIILIFVWTTSFSGIFPIVFKINGQYKIKDYKINRDKQIIESLKNSMMGITGSFYQNCNNLIDHQSLYTKHIKDEYYVVIFNPDIVKENDNNKNKTKVANYNIKNIGKKNLNEYCIYNILEIASNKYYDKTSSSKCKNYYNTQRFIVNAKILYYKKSTIIIYPIEYYFIGFGQDIDGFFFPFRYKYGQNILICQDNTVIQVKVLSDSKKDLIQKNVDFTNNLLTELHKASKDKNYKIDLTKYKKE